jgi:hypothetical protein
MNVSNNSNGNPDIDRRERELRQRELELRIRELEGELKTREGQMPQAAAQPGRTAAPRNPRQPHQTLQSQENPLESLAGQNLDGVSVFLDCGRCDRGDSDCELVGRDFDCGDAQLGDL